MSARRGKVLLALFFLSSLIFLVLFADRDGYEGDDLNSVLPMLHLQEAKQGALEVYRYHWQPLSYEIGSAVFRLIGKPTAIFLLSPLAGAISLLLLFLVTWRDRSSMPGFAKSLLAILVLPELWFAGLYFNSTVLGLPFALGCLFFLRSSSTSSLCFLSGVLLGIAVLMRLDFILAAPAMALIAPEKKAATNIRAMVKAVMRDSERAVLTFLAQRGPLTTI